MIVLNTCNLPVFLESCIRHNIRSDMGEAQNFAPQHPFEWITWFYYQREGLGNVYIIAHVLVIPIGLGSIQVVPVEVWQFCDENEFLAHKQAIEKWRTQEEK